MTTSQRLRRKRKLQFLFCGLVGFLLPVIQSRESGIPQPTIHDEFSYLLAADTFAHGRLTNPSPPLPEFFEAPHILVEPSYQSKYPPGSPLFLAAGQLIFGHPIWGQWMECGLFGAALCWMLQSFRFRFTAVLMTIFAILALVPQGMVGRGYWPGMLTVASAAFMYGGVMKTVRRPSINSTVVLTLGVIGLALTRPFEGMLVCLGVLPPLLFWMVRDKRDTIHLKFQSVIIPGLMLLGFTAGVLAQFNRAVTGSWRTMPYSTHHRQYFHDGVFLFQGLNTPTRTPPKRIQATYLGFHEEAMTSPQSGFARGFKRFCQALNAALGATQGSSIATIAIPLIVLGWLQRRVRIFLLSVVLWFFGLLVTTWNLPWYSTPIMPLFYAALAADLQLVARFLPKRFFREQLTPSRLMILGAVIVAVITVGRWESVKRRTVRLIHGASVEAPVAPPAEDGTREIDSRAQLLRFLQSIDGQHLIFVGYDDSYTIHDEWVYNGADIPNSKNVFAHDLGTQKNEQLISMYPARQIWKLYITNTRKRLALFQPIEVSVQSKHE